MTSNDKADSPLHELARRAGIEPTYRDAWGDEQVVADETLQAVLDIMGFAATSDAQIDEAIDKVEAKKDEAPEPVKKTGRAWLPPALTRGGRRWGLAIQLYGLRTADTWGIGDFSALTELVHGAAKLGAAAIGVNPLHALFPMRPESASPYSPSSRRFLNTLYLDVAAIADFADCEAVKTLITHPEFKARLQHVRAATQVQYAEVAALKGEVLALLYQRFCDDVLPDDGSGRGQQFRQFQEQQGAGLRRFATFHALSEHQGEPDWRNWPESLQDPDSSEVAAFVSDRTEEIEYHEYLQWQALLQLQQVEQTAHACGMSIGLYADFAVGADPGGAESWDLQALQAQGATIGAPPDVLNLSGQDWGLPPLDPLALAAANYAPLVDLWEGNMRHAGALRIDHIMGLMRLYWIPAGAAPDAGAYVRYPVHELLHRLALQSQQSHCMVIGEDLGTVPEGLRPAMQDADILSYRLLYFQQQDDEFIDPADYPANALVAIGTHDLPPLPMWWAGEDLELRERLGLWPSDDKYAAAREERERDRNALLAALDKADLAPSEGPDKELIEACYALLARTPCRLLMVQLDDVLDVHVQANLPGTADEYPNWRQRLPFAVADALAHPRMQRIAQMLAENGRSDLS